MTLEDKVENWLEFAKETGDEIYAPEKIEEISTLIKETAHCEGKEGLALALWASIQGNIKNVIPVHKNCEEHLIHAACQPGAHRPD